MSELQTSETEQGGPSSIATRSLCEGEQQPASPFDRLTSLFEVVVCSGYPTQLIVGGVLTSLGLMVFDETGGLSLRWIVIVSFTDAAAVLGLIFYFLRRRGDSPSRVFLGSRPIGREVAIGLGLMLVSLFVALISLSGLHAVAPGLRNVPENPLQYLLSSPSSAAIFTVVAIVAGAVREELQRAFVLYRFEQHLGGAWRGLAIFSVAFGLGHLLQGWDTAIVTGLLGACWGATYLLRRSVASTMVAHAGFNVTEILLALTASLGAEGLTSV